METAFRMSRTVARQTPPCTRARELCNRIDDDCDGVPDNNPVDPIRLYVDADDDGFGDPATVFEGCRAGEGETTRPDDCDDLDAAVNPDQDEECWTGKDDDCDGEPGFCGPSGRPTTVALTARWPGSAGDTFGTATAWSLDPRGSGATVLVTGAPNAHGRAGRLLTLYAPLDVADGHVQSWTGMASMPSAPPFARSATSMKMAFPTFWSVRPMHGTAGEQLC